MLTLSLIGCSKNSNDENISNPIPQNLIGTWKFVGYYSDTINPETGTNYYPFANGEFTRFNENGTYSNAVTNTILGTYTVVNDVITFNSYATSSNPASSSEEKIHLLTNDVLEHYTNINTPLFDIYRYEKISTTPTISGKK